MHRSGVGSNWLRLSTSAATRGPSATSASAAWIDLALKNAVDSPEVGRRVSAMVLATQQDPEPNAEDGRLLRVIAGAYQFRR